MVNKKWMSGNAVQAEAFRYACLKGENRLISGRSCNQTFTKSFDYKRHLSDVYRPGVRQMWSDIQTVALEKASTNCCFYYTLE